MKVALYGVGAIGANLGGELARRGCEIVGAIDTDPAKIGRRLSHFIDSPEPLNQIITRTSSDVLGHDPDIVVVHATSSKLTAVVEQLEEIIRCGHAIVSTCEELAFPAATDAVLTRRLNTLAGLRLVVGSGA
jgi:4-hydroxy-tetrahydrodipicolinate reductase